MADTKVIVIPDGKICDYIDGKFRNDIPEEYVRQTIEKRLVGLHNPVPMKGINISEIQKAWLGGKNPLFFVISSIAASPSPNIFKGEP